MGCGGSKDAASTPTPASTPKEKTEGAKPAAGLLAKPETNPAPKPDAKPGKKAPMPPPWVLEMKGPIDSKEMLLSMLDQMFDSFDVNGDGSISREELTSELDSFLKRSDTISGNGVQTLLAESGLNPFLNIFDQLDANKDGKITRQEFKEQLQPAKAAKVIGELLKEVFDSIDVNKDGSLTPDELNKAYGQLFEKKEVKSGKSWSTLLVDAGLNPDFYVFEQLDDNSDGKVTWEEFSSRLKAEEVWVMEPCGGNAIQVVNAMLDQIFDKCDVNGDGFISREELSDQMDKVLQTGQTATGKSVKALVAESGLNPFFSNFDQLDANHDGKITRQEFKEQLQPSGAAKSVEEMMREIFDGIDKNGDGSLSREELSAAYGSLLTTKEARTGKYWYNLLVDAGLNPYVHVFDQLDANGDGRITWEEFSSRLNADSKPDADTGKKIEISDESKSTGCCG